MCVCVCVYVCVCVCVCVYVCVKYKPRTKWSRPKLGCMATKKKKFTPLTFISVCKVIPLQARCGPEGG